MKGNRIVGPCPTILYGAIFLWIMCRCLFLNIRLGHLSRAATKLEPLSPLVVNEREIIADYNNLKKATMPPKKAGKGAKMVTEPPKEKKKKGAKSGKKRKESYAIYIYKVGASPIALIKL